MSSVRDSTLDHRAPRGRVHPRVCWIVAGLAGAALCMSSAADVTSVKIPLAPHGDDQGGGQNGAVWPLSPTSLLVGAQGADSAPRTADDVTLLVTGIGSTPVVKALATAYVDGWAPGITVLSATRALVPTAGPDGTFGTADDEVLLLDRLGSQDSVTPIVIAGTNAARGCRPVGLGPSRFVMASAGPDGTLGTADDAVAVVTDVGGASKVTMSAAPYLAAWSRSRPVALSPSSFLLVSNGPDASVHSADDTVYLFLVSPDGSTARRDLATPGLFQWGAGLPVRLTATRALIAATGADGIETSADDLLYLLDGLGTTDTVAAISVPSIGGDGAGMALPLAADRAIVATVGADARSETADDSFALLSDLGAGNDVAQIVVGPLGVDIASRPVRLGASSIAANSAGPDGDFNTSDDRVVVVSGLGTANAVSSIGVPGLTDRNPHRPLALTHDAIVVGNGGPDGRLGGGDDRISVISGIFGVPVFEHVTSFGGGTRDYWTAHQPRLLGEGRVAFASAGADDTFKEGGDDEVEVLSGLPSVRGLFVKTLTIGFRTGKKPAPTTFSVTGTLTCDELAPFGSEDVTISVGNAAQVVPASAVKVKKGVYTYADARHRNGFLTKVSWNSKSGALKIAGKGLGTGGETTHADYALVAVHAGDLYLADHCPATAGRTGIRYKAPRPTR